MAPMVPESPNSAEGLAFACSAKIANALEPGQRGVQCLPGLCEAWMPNASLQGCIHGGSRETLNTSLAGTLTTIYLKNHKKGRHKGGLNNCQRGQINSSRSNIADNDSSLLMRRMVSASIGASDSTRMRPVALAASDSGTVSVTTS